MRNRFGDFSRAAMGLALVSALGWSAISRPALAGSATLPGQTIGLPTGTQIPVGVYFTNLTSFGSRDTEPRNSESIPILPTVAWSTPWTVLGAWALSGLSSTRAADVRKKTAHATEQDRPDVKVARKAWFEGQPDLDPTRLVFLDET